MLGIATVILDPRTSALNHHRTRTVLNPLKCNRNGNGNGNGNVNGKRKGKGKDQGNGNVKCSVA